MTEKEIEDWLRGYSYDRFIRKRKKGEITNEK